MLLYYIQFVFFDILQYIPSILDIRFDIIILKKAWNKKMNILIIIYPYIF